MIDFDARSATFLADPLAGFAELRRACPVGWSKADEAWVVASYDAVYQVLQDHETFSNEAYSRGDAPPLLVLAQDPPIHSKYRRLLNPFFSPGIVDRLRPKMEAYSTELLDRVIERGSCDLILDYGNPFPALVVLELCGLPTDEWLKFAEPNHAMQYATPGSPEHDEALAGMRWIAEQIFVTAAARRDDPRDDLISALATAEVDGELVPLPDVVGITMTVVGGGVDTTTSLYGNAMRYLSQNLQARQRLLDEPELLATACEEFLRHFTPAQILSREVRKPVEVNGQNLCPGELLEVAVASANHDESAFPDAADMQIDRFPNRHAAFGLGIHRCVGSNVARAMIQLMIRHTLERMPAYRIVEEGARHYGSPIVNGWITMPATYPPGPRIGSGIALPTSN